MIVRIYMQEELSDSSYAEFNVSNTNAKVTITSGDNEAWVRVVDKGLKYVAEVTKQCGYVDSD